jgi:thioredoxin 1
MATTINANGTTLVEFSATWCGYCQQMKNTLNSISDKLEGVNVQIVDVDEEMDLAKQYKVRSLPTLILFKDGEEVDRHVGAMPAEQALEFILN